INPTETTFIEYTINLNNTTLSGSNNYIAFRHSSNSSAWYYWLDDFVVELLPSCIEPSALTATNLTYSSADLSWTSDGTAFDIKWDTSGFDVETEGTLVEDFENGATLSGLDSNTTYEFYVRNNCGGGDLSAWAGPYAFTTLLAPATIPWMEAFATTAIPTGWSNTGFSFGTAPGITNAAGGVDGNVIYKNLYGSAPSGSFQTIQVGLVSEGDVLSFIYKLNNYSSPYAPP